MSNPRTRENIHNNKPSYTSTLKFPPLLAFVQAPIKLRPPPHVTTITTSKSYGGHFLNSSADKSPKRGNMSPQLGEKFLSWEFFFVVGYNSSLSPHKGRPLPLLKGVALLFSPGGLHGCGKLGNFYHWVESVYHSCGR